MKEHVPQWVIELINRWAHWATLRVLDEAMNGTTVESVAEWQEVIRIS